MGGGMQSVSRQQTRQLAIGLHCPRLRYGVAMLRLSWPTVFYGCIVSQSRMQPPMKFELPWHVFMLSTSA